MLFLCISKSRETVPLNVLPGYGLCSEFGYVRVLWTIVANVSLRRIGYALWATATNLLIRYAPLCGMKWIVNFCDISTPGATVQDLVMPYGS
jgi:hypothetical protein